MRIFSLAFSYRFLGAVLMHSPYRHMIKYKYVPFDLGRKARYGSGAHH